MGLIKRGQKWYVQLRDNGRLVRQSTGTHIKKVAQEIEAKIKMELVEGKYFDKGQGNKKTFRDMVEKYMTEEAVKKAAKSKLRDEVSLKHLLPVFGDKYLSQITPNMITSYKLKRRQEGASASSINKELAFSKHAFNIAIKVWGWIKDNPFVRVPLEKMPSGRVKYLQDDEFERLCAVCNEPLRSIVILAGHTGLRQDNLLSLTWKQIDFRNETINVEHTKNGQPICIPMTQTAKNLLLELSKVKRIDTPYIFYTSAGKKLCNTLVSRWFRQASKRAGLEDFRFHDLRHHFASMLVQKGADLYTVQKLLGHQTSEMARRYSHLTNTNLRSVINLLDNKESEFKAQIGHSEQVV